MSRLGEFYDESGVLRESDKPGGIVISSSTTMKP